MTIKRFELLEAVVLEGGVIVGIHIVDAYDGGASQVVEQALHEVAANEPGCTGDEDCFSVKFYLLHI